MILEIVKDGIITYPPITFDDYDFMEDLEELKNEFRPLIMNRSVVKYFGIEYGTE